MLKNVLWHSFAYPNQHKNPKASPMTLMSSGETFGLLVRGTPTNAKSEPDYGVSKGVCGDCEAVMAATIVLTI